MKGSYQIFFSLFILLLSCKKKDGITPAPEPPPDPRDSVVGNYSGTRINTYWNMTSWVSDTANTTVNLSKSNNNLVNVIFTPPFSNSSYQFTYGKGVFTSTSQYHPPTLKKSADSLYFFEQPGLGPSWTSCRVKRN